MLLMTMLAASMAHPVPDVDPLIASEGEGTITSDVDPLSRVSRDVDPLVAGEDVDPLVAGEGEGAITSDVDPLSRVSRDTEGFSDFCFKC